MEVVNVEEILDSIPASVKADIDRLRSRFMAEMEGQDARICAAVLMGLFVQVCSEQGGLSEEQILRMVKQSIESWRALDGVDTEASS